MLSAAADSPHHEQLAGPGGPLRTEVGDTLIMNADHAAGIPRIGEIVAVLGPDGSPAYRVRWLAGGVRVDRLARAVRTGQAGPLTGTWPGAGDDGH
jgi:hypothetical protein